MNFSVVIKDRRLNFSLNSHYSWASSILHNKFGLLVCESFNNINICIFSYKGLVIRFVHFLSMYILQMVLNSSVNIGSIHPYLKYFIFSLTLLEDGSFWNLFWVYLRYISSMTSEPITICWIRTGSQPDWKIMYRIVLHNFLRISK